VAVAMAVACGGVWRVAACGVWLWRWRWRWRVAACGGVWRWRWRWRWCRYVSGPQAKEALRLSGCGDGLGWRVVAVEGATVESGASAMAAMGAAAAQIRCACPAGVTACFAGGGEAAGGQASVGWISHTAPPFLGIRTPARMTSGRAQVGPEAGGVGRRR
jgi:hypothetical protein